MSHRGPPSHPWALGLAQSTGKAWTCETEVSQIWLNIWSSSVRRAALQDGRLWYWPRTIAISYKMENLTVCCIQGCLLAPVIVSIGFLFQHPACRRSTNHIQQTPPQTSTTYFTLSAAVALRSAPQRQLCHGLGTLLPCILAGPGSVRAVCSTLRSAPWD